MAQPIPYSRCGASLPPRPKQAPRKHLFHKISSLSLFDKKPTAEKWHRQIDETASGRRPVSESNDDFFLFPWAQLRLHTDEYLRKHKTSELDHDGVLCGLIASHDDKVVALAACAHLLSPRALLEVLGAFSNQSQQTEDYLQAFVAASHGVAETFAPQDEAWARTLIAVLKATQVAAPSALVLETLFVQFRSSPLPSHQILAFEVPAVIGPLLQILGGALNDWRRQQDWISALAVRGVLAKIDESIGGGSRNLEELLQLEIPQWRNWAAWQPNEERLRLWQSMSKDFLGPLWALLGPNFDYVDGVHFSMLSEIIRDGAFTSWLESHGVMPGFGLLVNDTPHSMTTFAHHLFSVIDTVCAEGGIASKFFWHLWLDDSLGLDQRTLQLWELAQKSLFQRAPAFLSAVLQGGPGQEDPTSMISVGLCALDNAAYKDLQEYLASDIRHLINESAMALRSTFLTELQSENDWFASGSAMIHFRTTVAKFTWLGDLSSAHLNISSDTLVTVDSLTALQGLHWTLQHREVGLEPVVRAYIGNIVLGQSTKNDDGLSVIRELHKLWQLPKYQSHRSAAVVLAHLNDVSASHRARCLKDMYIFTEHQVKKLEDAMIGIKHKSTAMCHCIVRLAAKTVRNNAKAKDAWAAVARYVLETYNISPRYAVSDKSTSHCSFKKYRNWIWNLRCVFGDLVEDVEASITWLDSLDGVKKTLSLLQDIPEFQRAMHCIYTSYRPPYSGQTLKALRSVQKESREERYGLMFHVMLSLNEKTLAKQVVETLALLSSISDDGFKQCQELVVLSDKESVYIAAVQMQVWMQNEAMPGDTKKALRYLGAALRLPSSPQAATAKDYFLKRIAAMMKSAHELEGMRTYLKCSDRVGVATVLTDLGLEDPTSAMEEEILDLPNELLNFVEQVDDNTVELQFPLTGIKELQRNAMGLRQNESLVVRLTTNDNGSRESFCVHAIDSHTDWDGMVHDSVKARAPVLPSRQTCKRNSHSRVAYVIMRCIWRKLRFAGKSSLAEIYKEIETSIKTFGNKCLTCDSEIWANLYRPTTCNKPPCQRQYFSSDLTMRLADLHLNQKSVGLLLAAVQAAALAMSSGATNASLNLLPDRPERLADNKKLITMLDSIPAIPTLVNTLPDLNSLRKRHTLHHELLFSWALNNYQGFIVEATGALRIPNMPNVQQFVLADSPPEITAAFAKHDQLQPRQVLFHGTSMERLFAILCQGLKVLSNTALQVNGAAYGTGIYLAEQPSLAVSYSRATQRRSSTFSTQHAEFVNQRVLLGIEYAGDDGNRGNGIYVAPDPTKLLLRYIFLLPATFQAPLANHVVPAMQSNFYTLKAGAKSAT